MRNSVSSLNSTTVECNKVLQGQRDHIFKRQNVMYSKMNQERGRDAFMYHQTDRLNNIGLDNSKDERAVEAARLTEERLVRA